MTRIALPPRLNLVAKQPSGRSRTDQLFCIFVSERKWPVLAKVIGVRTCSSRENIVTGRTRVV